MPDWHERAAGLVVGNLYKFTAVEDAEQPRLRLTCAGITFSRSMNG